MRVPSIYEEGYQKARLMDPVLTDRYAAYMWVGDPLADAVMRDVASLDDHEVARLIGGALELDDAVVRAAPESLQELGHFADPIKIKRSREPGGVRGEARRPGLARPPGRLSSRATPIPRSGTALSPAGALVRAIFRPGACEPNAGGASRRPPESLRPAPCEPPAPGQKRPGRLQAALTRTAAPARHAAAGLLVVFAGLLAVSTAAQAQTLTTLVSNTGEALAIGVTSSINAQSFVTGFNAGGYAISAVQIRLKSVSGKTTVVRIREDDNGNPGDLVATLTNPASLSSYDINTFTAPPGTTLAASTTYWITTSEGVFILSRLTSALTGATAEIGEPGWSIGDGRLFRSRDRDPWFTETQSSLLIAIKGTAIGAASDDATLSALALTVDDGTNHLTLGPAFAPGTFAYAAAVGTAVTTVTLTAMTTDDGASVSAVTLDGAAITDVDFTDGITVSPLLVGDNGIDVTVTAENGDTRTYTVTVTRQAAVDNTAPTASDASVTTNEDTAHTFVAADVNFSDSDGDALASVTVVTLPAEGALALNGTAVTAGQVVPAADIAQLVFTPAANGNGTGYARFTFRVSDGTDLSASAYTMTVNVTAVNDPATGAPAISGTAQVGQTLTAATTDIADADGLDSPSYGYQWVRVDGSNETDIAGATSGTYMPEAADVGKKLKVKVSFTDDDSNDEELTSDAYPASGTVEAVPTTAPTVTISADKTSAVFKEDDITYTVTRTGSTTAALPVTVRLTQTEDFLATEFTSKTVTIGAGQSTATFTVAASSFQHFAAGTKVGGGTLTATVQDGSAYDPGTTDSVEVDIAIGVMIGFEMAAYSVGEATGPVKVKVIAHTGPGAGQPTSEATYNILPADGSATNRSDFFFVNIPASFLVSNFSESGGVWQAEHGYDVTITNDEDDEDDETFDLRIERVQSTATYSLVDASGNSCGSVCTATVTIIDDDTATATPGVTVSTTALTVTEQDTTGGSYTVVLDSEPTATVTVTVAGHAGTDVTRTPGTLTFTTSNWDTAQTVTVTAGNDTDTTDDSVTLTHSAASTDTGYSGITIAGVVVTVRDNDTAQVTGVTVDAGDARLVVNWTAVDNATGYTVQWKSGNQGYNTGNRQATVTSGTTTSHTITGLTNGTAYSVQVSATRTGANDGPPSAGVTKTPEANTSTNTDPLTLTVEAVQATVTEGEPVRYRIVMSKPTRGVEVEAVYRYRGEFLRHDPSSTLTGIRSRRGVLHWEVERQTLDDAVDEADGRFTVRLQPGDGYQLGTPSVARVTIRDNDPEAVSPPVVSVADATVEEGMGPLAFRVTLDRAPLEEVSVAWETLEGRAKGRGLGKDYEAATGTLTFRPGETVKTVNVTVIDDVVDEGQETMALYLWNPVGVVIADAVAKGTIKNSDPLPRALMGRFGRTAAVHVVERVEARMAAPRTVGVEAQFAGREVRPGMEREMALDFLRQLGASAGRHAPDGGSGGTLSGSPMAAAAGSMGLAAGMGRPAGGAMGLAAGPMDGRASPDGGLFDRGLASMGLGGGNLLTGSSFAVTRETRQGGLLSFWSRGARSSFAGREGALGLDGDVRTMMVGADYATGPLVVGLSLAHSRGLGGYHGPSALSSGHVASSVTGLYPWLGYTVSDRVSVWGVTGYGTGALALTPGEAPALTSGLSMGMAAGGMRGDLADSVVAGFGLAFKADALWVGTAIDGVDGPGGNLGATEAAVTRVRTGLEASRGYRFERGLSLTPSVEVGLRHDGGDAERGAGLDVGAGLVVSDTSTGLAVDVRVRMLLVHQADGFSERGLSLAVSYDPTPSTPLGFTARVEPSWGGQAQSGAAALWGRQTMAGMAPGGVASGNRLDGEVGYGLPVGSRFVGTPTLGVGTSADGRDYRLGYRLGARGGAGTVFELGVDAQRRERLLQGDTDHAALARATLRW